MEITEELIRRSQKRNRGPAALVKRLLDIIGSSLGLVVLLPVFATVALLVKLEDGEAVFYRRRVVGRNGEFGAFKFRSMYPDAEARLDADSKLLAEYSKNFKLVDDPRITRIGKFLRKNSLDELPQLINVLRGQMSLIGPRMITMSELAKYGDAAPLLLTIRPGMTGYWQTEGRQTASYTERVRMDVFYIRNWSIFLDLKILAKTPWKVIKREGAY